MQGNDLIRIENAMAHASAGTRELAAFLSDPGNLNKVAEQFLRRVKPGSTSHIGRRANQTKRQANRC